VNEVSQQEQRVELRQILTLRFDEGELRTLCFDLGIEYENLPGTTKADKARELVLYFEHRGRIPELLELIRNSRPETSLDDTSEVATDASFSDLPSECLRYINDPLLLARPGLEGPVRQLLDDVVKARENAEWEDALRLCGVAEECAGDYGDQAEIALIFLYKADAQSRNNQLKSAIDLTNRAGNILGWSCEHYWGDCRNTMVAQLQLARLQAAKDPKSAWEHYHIAGKLCQQLETGGSSSEDAQIYKHVSTGIRLALEDVSSTIKEQYAIKCILNSIPILQLSDGPETISTPSGSIDFVAASAFMIKGRTYFLYPINETKQYRLELKPGVVHFALPVRRDGWLVPTSNKQDYAVVRHETKIAQEGPAVSWTEKGWLGGQFERDVTTGRIHFVALQDDIKIIGREECKEPGCVIGLLKPTGKA
jgi:hypothetical protein